LGIGRYEELAKFWRVRVGVRVKVGRLGLAHAPVTTCGGLYIDFSPRRQFAPWTFRPTLDTSPVGDSPIDDSPHEHRAKRPQKNVGHHNTRSSCLCIGCFSGISTRAIEMICAFHHAMHIGIYFSLRRTLLSSSPKNVCDGNNAKVRVRRNIFSGRRVCGRFAYGANVRLWGNRP